jgi:hypothetical protein
MAVFLRGAIESLGIDNSNDSLRYKNLSELILIKALQALICLWIYTKERNNLPYQVFEKLLLILKSGR